MSFGLKTVEQSDTHARCPECKSPHLIEDVDMGELVCRKCGLVLKEGTLDRSPEWRAFTLEESLSKRRVGAPSSYFQFDKGLSTTIRVDRDAFGRRLPPETKSQMWRLRRWQIRSQMGDKGRNLVKAMDVLQRLCEKLQIPSPVQETAAVIYRKALNQGLVQGRSIVALVAASLYVACRLTRTPKTLNEIVGASLRSRKEVSRCYRTLLRRLEIRQPIHDPIEYITKIAEKAGIPSEVQGLAVRILREAKGRQITAGKDPMGVAASVLYVASQLKKNKKITLESIAKAAKRTEVTIRNRKKDLVKGLNLKI